MIVINDKNFSEEITNLTNKKIRVMLSNYNDNKRVIKMEKVNIDEIMNEEGKIYLNTDKTKYLIVDIEKNPVFDLTHEEEEKIWINRHLEEHKTAYEKLAKWEFFNEQALSSESNAKVKEQTNSKFLD